MSNSHASAMIRVGRVSRSAKDCDMGAGITTFGQIRDAKGRETGRYKTRNDFLHAIGEIVQQSIVNMMILSVPTSRRQSPRRYSRAARLRSRRRRTTRQTSGLIFGTEPMPNNLLVRFCPRLSSMFSTALFKRKSPKLVAVALAKRKITPRKSALARRQA